MQNKKNIAIIPARGNSKGIPRKNIKLLAGKPLIAYTIEAALKSKYLDRVIVSTEDKEIREMAIKYGAEVMKRPKNLATDAAKTIDVVFHALRVLRRQKYIPGVIVLLQPTSPLRNKEDIKKAIKLFFAKRGNSVISVTNSPQSPFWMHKIDKNGFLKPLLKLRNYYKRRQELPETYVENGAIYIITPENLRKYNGFYTKKTLPYIMPPERSIDIDTEIDFRLAELIIKNGENKNRK